MRRNADRTARPCPSPNHEAPLLRRKHKLLQVREKGELALQGRQGPQRRAAGELKPGAREAPSPPARGPERPCLAHLFSAAGGQAREHRPDPEGSAQRGAARLQRAGEKHRAEKGHREEPGRPQARRTKRKAGGAEKQGAARATGQTRRAPGPPGRNKGRRVPSTTTGGEGHDPQARRGANVEKLLPAVEDLERLGKTGREGARDGPTQPGKEASSPGPGLKNNGLDQGPQGKVKDLEQPWPVGSPCRRGAVSPGSLGQHGVRSTWQRELEFTFEELFDTNRKLKKHLILNLDPRSGAEHSPGGEHGPSGMQDDRGETLRDQKTGDVGADVEPGGEPARPALVDAHQTASEDSLTKFLSELENQKNPRLAKFRFKHESKPFPKAGMLMDEENQLPCGTGSGQAPARLDPLAQGPRQPALQDPPDGAGWMAFRPRQRTEPERRPGRRPEEPTGPPGLSWEAHSRAALEEQREQRRACLARLKSHSLPDQEEEEACERSTTSPLASSCVDDRHGQMIHDLEQQIEEQNKLHKQFLEDARKRLQEFQRI
ncbi:protein DDC8 homolog [Crocuta crocuta]